MTALSGVVAASCTWTFKKTVGAMRIIPDPCLYHPDLLRHAPFSAILVAEVLLLAHESPEQRETNFRNSAVTWRFLKQVFGLRTGDLHWLVKQDLLSHQAAFGTSLSKSRTLSPPKTKSITENSCFALKEEAMPLLRELVAAHSSQLAAYRKATQKLRQTVQLNMKPTSRGECRCHENERLRLEVKYPIQKPTWDDEEKELRVGEIVVKTFRRTAVNQQLILSAFEEENWPEWIDDPLPPKRGIQSRQRLKETVKSLNRQQKSERLHFYADSTKKRIRWKLSPPDHPPDTH